MTPDETNLLARLAEIVKSSAPRLSKLQEIAMVLRTSGSHRWVGLYDVDIEAGEVRNAVFDGPGPPEFPVFPISKGLTAGVVSTGKAVNVGDVSNDPRYLTAFHTTRSEIIIPVFSDHRNVVGTIDIESERPHAFSEQQQRMLERCAEVICPLWGPAASEWP